MDSTTELTLLVIDDPEGLLGDKIVEKIRVYEVDEEYIELTLIRDDEDGRVITTICMDRPQARTVAAMLTNAADNP